MNYHRTSPVASVVRKKWQQFWASSQVSASSIDELFERANNQLRQNAIGKKEIIKDLKDLADAGIPKDSIAAEISRRLTQWVSDSYIRDYLGEEYTRRYPKQLRNTTEKSSIPTPELEKVETPVVHTSNTEQILVSKSGPPPDEPKKWDEGKEEELQYFRVQVQQQQKQEKQKPDFILFDPKLIDGASWASLRTLVIHASTFLLLNDKNEVIKIVRV